MTAGLKRRIVAVALMCTLISACNVELVGSIPSAVPFIIMDFDDNVGNGRSVTFRDKSVTGMIQITSWKWKFGDGQEASGKEAVHTYAHDGVYTVTLIVKDDWGLQYSKEKEITVITR